MFSAMLFAEQIHNWINSRRDLDAGRSLLAAVSDQFEVNSTVVQLVNQFSNSATKDLLVNEFERILTLNTPASQPATKSVASKRFKDNKHINLPPNLEKLYQQTKRWYRELDTLKGKSRAIPEGDELRDAALKIIELRKSIIRAYERLDYFTEFGVEMDSPVNEMPVDGQVKKLTQYMRALKNNPPYISKNKNSKDPDIQAKVAEKRQELADANEYLKEHAV